MIRRLFAILAASAACASAAVPTVDGVLGVEEWAGSQREQLVGGGEVRLLRVGDVLYVAVRGSALGIASLCITRGDDVTILHASAALGTARYARKVEGWSLANGFEWKVRDSGAGVPLAPERNEFYAEEGWVANSSSTGAPVREFRIKLDGSAHHIGVTYFATDSKKVSYWPASMSDDCRAAQLIMGNTPKTPRFDPPRWHAIAQATDSGQCALADDARKRISAALQVPPPCQRDDQCYTMHFGCPFPCVAVLGRSQRGMLEQAVKDFRAAQDAGACPDCMYKCAAAEMQRPARCVNNHCVLGPAN